MYVAYMKVHNPNFRSAEWKGKSAQGNFSDSMMELDAKVGKVVQAVRDAGIERDTIVVFSSNNGLWIEAWPDVEGRKRNTVRERLARARPYVDTRPHPGRDRSTRYDVAYGHTADDCHHGGAKATIKQ